MCADAADILYLVFVFFLCIRCAAAADTLMFIVLSYTSVSYVADAAIYLYHYCVLCFCVSSISYVADAAIYLYHYCVLCFCVSSISYVADAAIYLYHYCVLCFCVSSISYVADAAIYLHDLSFVCSPEPLAPLCAWWVNVHITLGFVFLGFLACAPCTNPVLVMSLFVSKCLTGWSTKLLQSVSDKTVMLLLVVFWRYFHSQ